MLAFVLLRLSRIYGDDELERRAVGGLPARATATSSGRPAAVGWMLCALELHFSPPHEIAVVGPADDPATEACATPRSRGSSRNAVYAFAEDGRTIRRLERFRC